MMIGSIFNNKTLNVLKKGIEGTNLRHEAIANNIANVDTPNYQRATVNFEDQLKRVLRGNGIIGRRTDDRHFIIGGPQEIAAMHARADIDNKTRFRADKNNVNIDEEMAAMAETSERNVQFTELLTRKYSGLKKVIEAQIK